MTVLLKTCRNNLRLFLGLLEVIQKKKVVLEMNFVNMKKLT